MPAQLVECVVKILLDVLGQGLAAERVGAVDVVVSCTWNVRVHAVTQVGLGRDGLAAPTTLEFSRRGRGPPRPPGRSRPDAEVERAVLTVASTTGWAVPIEVLERWRPCRRRSRRRTSDRQRYADAYEAAMPATNRGL